MPHPLIANTSDQFDRLHGNAPRHRALRSLGIAALITASLLTSGCKSTPAPTTAATTPQPQAPLYPARPTTPPPPFKLFHQSPTSITLVTSETATDEEIEAILWQLRDAAHAHTFGTLHIPQKLVDHRDHKIWFHLYRGSKCASEKYADGPPPCGGSYHAAGDYTFGSYTNPEQDNATLLHGDDQETPLWDPEKLYTSTKP